MSANKTDSAVDDVTAIQNVPARIVTAWAENDADAFAAVFAEDGSLILPGDVYLTSREQVREFMAAGFAGPYKGSKVYGEPLAVRPLDGDYALIITRGGVLMPGETEVAAERAIRASWLLTKQGSDWLIAAYQNTPVNVA
jgi:uncharacterized protein (TIGR02246 family)